MKDYTYVIIGGGMAGSAAVMGIRKNDSSGTIAMFSKEAFGPYNRPPLSKALWDKGKIADIMRPMDKYHVDLYLETSIKYLDPGWRQAMTADGERFGYEKLLLATGGHPIHLPNEPEGVIAFRTRADYQQLKSLAKSKKTFCVIGGGFIGSEIAAALTKNGNQVTLVFPETGLSARVFPNNLSEFLNQYYIYHGVNVLSSHLVQSLTKQDESYLARVRNVSTGEENEMTFDGVVLGIGIKPNVTFAKEAGLKVENGIHVNQFLQTDNPRIYAAGDVANFYSKTLQKRVRVEHEDNANTMGMVAGLNMSGEAQPYEYLPFFYSDLFDLGYEAIGEMDKNLEVYEDWVEPFKKGVIYYLDNGQVKGLIFWDIWGKTDQGREVISQGKTYTKAELKGLFTQEKNK